MNKADVLAHFGSQKAVADALGITRPAVGQWGEVVPYFSAKRLAEISGYQLKLDPTRYDEKGRPAKSA